MKPLSRQRLAQIRNLENGMCQHHKGRPLWNSTAYCKECLLKRRELNGVKKPYPTKEQWASIDWSLQVKEIAKSLNVTEGAVRYQWKKLAK